MSFLKKVGVTTVCDPFNCANISRYVVYVGVTGDAGKCIYDDVVFSGVLGRSFIAANPYPSYRIQEYDILLKPKPSVCYCNGILWKSDEYYMFINYNGDVVITKNYVPGEFLSPDETLRDMEHWVLTRAGGAIHETTFTGRHYKDPEKNITVVKEFPRWIRRDDGSTNNINMPYGYYDPVDGAEGVIRIGECVENDINGTPIKEWRGTTKITTTYLGDVLTWKQ